MKYRWTKDTPFSKAGAVFETEKRNILFAMKPSPYGADELNVWKTAENLITDGWLEPADKPMTKTWETIEAGDYVVDGDCTHKVLARINNVVLLSNDKYLGEAWEITPMLGWTHIEELKLHGYTIVQPEGETKYYASSTSDALKITTEIKTKSEKRENDRLSFDQGDPIHDDSAPLFSKDSENYCGWCHKYAPCEHSPQEVQSEPQPESSSDSQVERWKPEMGENYFSIHTNYGVTEFYWENDNTDNGVWNNYNCFRTREEAFHAADETRKLWKRLADKK